MIFCRLSTSTRQKVAIRNDTCNKTFSRQERPCIVIEENNQVLVLGYLTDRKREEWLRKAAMMENGYQLALKINSLYTLNETMESEG